MLFFNLCVYILNYDVMKMFCFFLSFESIFANRNVFVKSILHDKLLFRGNLFEIMRRLIPTLQN